MTRAARRNLARAARERREREERQRERVVVTLETYGRLAAQLVHQGEQLRRLVELLTQRQDVLGTQVQALMSLIEHRSAMVQ